MSPSRKKPRQDEDTLVDFNQPDSADPAVRALIQQGERLRSESRLSRRERDKILKERRKIRERRASHTCYDIPPELRAYIKELSEELRIPASQLAALALLRFVRDYQGGEIDLSPFKTPSSSPRFDWNLDLDIEEYGLAED
jgi:hypothetical protein